jgi:hypothetical protein
MTSPEPDVAGPVAPEADLTGWTGEPFTAAGYTHDVYRKGGTRRGADPGDARHPSRGAGSG